MIETIVITRGTIINVEPVRKTVNGNVIRRATFDNGQSFETVPDASVSFAIENYVGKSPLQVLMQCDEQRRSYWKIADVATPDDGHHPGHWSLTRQPAREYRVDQETGRAELLPEG